MDRMNNVIMLQLKNILIKWSINVILNNKKQRRVDTMEQERVNLIIKVSPEFRQKIKVYTVLNNITIQDYVLELLERDMKEKENKSK